jgi:hypothetical protein
MILDLLDAAKVMQSKNIQTVSEDEQSLDFLYLYSSA